jgi:aerobic-type carbon monoxide dehydrogenase small subunit (CoxS/CutS family)
MSTKLINTEVTLHVNGSKIRANPTENLNLLGLLRHELKLTGTKPGCASGHCGACTVLVDGNAMQACQLNLAALENNHVETIEHIVQTPLGQDIVAVLMRYSAAQCGYCLPGIVVSAYAEMHLAEKPDPVRALERNLCRCGTHSRILTALQELFDVAETNTSDS